MWTLITVTGDAQVHHSTGYASRHLCEQAKSLALTGMTIEQCEERVAAKRKQDEKDRTTWRAAHPPRQPTDEERRRWKGMLGSIGPYCTIGEDGLLYEWPGSCFVSSAYGPDESIAHMPWGEMVVRQKYEIKHAECVLTDAPAPTPRREG